MELALTTTGLDDALNDRSATYTVFAPTDDAFDKLGDTLTTLLADPDTLSNILQYHVINGASVDAATATGLAGKTQEMLNSNNIAITVQGDALFINNAQVIITDVETANGIIHAIDTVITPPAMSGFSGTITEAAVSTDDLSTLVTALTAANLTDALSDETKTYTVFAPVNSAFAKIDASALDALLADTDALSDVLTYHVIADSDIDFISAAALTGTSVKMLNGDSVDLKYMGGELYVNGSKVITPNIATNNGTVHLIDTVLMPPLGSIVDVAVADGRFTKLAEALQATNLVDTLANPDEMFTVFAPTDDAFAKLGQETFDALLDDTDTLSSILLYHVVKDAKIDSATAIGAAGTTLATANTNTFSINLVGEDLFINDSKVIITDVQADNGVIHVVDTVIVPPGTVTDVAIKAGVFDGLATALINAGIEESVANEMATKTVLDATELTATLASTDTQFTVFMPTADAFAALGQATLDSLAQNPNQLKDILLYHTVSGSKLDSTAAVAAAGTDLTMANEGMTSVMVQDGMLYINDAKVVTANIQASNGIIHFIDKVIMEPTL